MSMTERVSVVESNGKSHEATAGEHVVEIECLASRVRVAGYCLADGTAMRRGGGCGDVRAGG